MSQAVQVVPIDQAWPERVEAMTRAIQLFDGPIDALEVGTWFGLGSTRIWLDHLKPGSSLTLVDPWRPYASADDLADPGWNYAAMDSLMLEAYLSTLMTVRKFEAEHPGRLKIDILRGDSERVLGRMRDASFDFIYVDGDHKYKSVLSNLRRLSMRCLRWPLDELPTPIGQMPQCRHGLRDGL